MDFFQISVKERKGGVLEASPDFVVGRTEDLMVRAKTFYAIWDEDRELWSTDEYDVQRIVDSRLKAFADKNPHVGTVKYMRNFSSNSQSQFRKYLSQISDNAHQLDEKLTFQGTKVGKKDYVSKRLPYDLTPGDHSAWDELVSTLYKPEEREKIEWAFGSIISGESKKNQKFVVLYGPPGAGKGTIINIALMLYDGYVTTFDAKALGSSGNQFAAAAFANNPLVAIQHDGDLSRIEDNTLLNSIVSHEIMKVNEKYKPSYDARINAFLIMGTNKPVKITDAQSGLIRRLIDVHPSGNRLAPKQYHALMDRIKFELGAIAHHCLMVYKDLGKNYYSNYRPLEMMFKTNAFFNFIEAYYDIFEKHDGVSSKQAWNLYKEYCSEANIERPMSMYAFKSELGNYFGEFEERHTMEDGTVVRSWYSGFKAQPFKTPVDDDVKTFTLIMDSATSLLDLEFAEYAAQYTSSAGTPKQKWENVKTTLAEIDTSKEHYVNGFPENHIVIDFDLRDEDGNKSLERNLEAASLWPATYAEVSKSGQGVHLHYYYNGDVSQLDPSYADGIEIKVYTGNSALRRRLSKCNNVPVATISSGLPLKEKKRVLDPGVLRNEQGLRKQIEANLRKEYHPGTKPSIDFIKHILEQAYEENVQFDVSDMRGKITAFANNSTNKALECLKIVQTMRWKSKDDEPAARTEPDIKDERLVIYDVECYPNLFLICWKFEEEHPSKDSVTVMINPKPHEVEALFNFKLVGFNNRDYDNHMLWGAAMGYNNQQLYNLSQKIINGGVGAKFGEAYNVSWADIYDFSTKKQGLKKWQIELGLDHREMDIPWDQPVPEDRLMDVVDYCSNDVVSTEFVLKFLDGDWTARKILADLSGLTPNDTTAKHTARIVFGGEKNPQSNFVYTRLEKEFPGYVFEAGKSTYRGEVVGEGGYVYAEPGLYHDTVLLDVASMHPTSIGQLNLFGDYTPRYMALVEAQLAIKHGDYAAAKTLLDGKLRPYIEDIERLLQKDPAAAKKAAGDLRYGLKIAINIVYGLTSAKFDNPFKHNLNVDNIVAKRGALFMIDLKHALQERGCKVVHIKTDSVKIVNATAEDIEFVTTFGQKYSYTFEHEATYDKFGLFNDAVYVAHYDSTAPVNIKNGKSGWTATGTQFHVETNPYVFKKLFGNEDDINFNDLCVTRNVRQGAIYLDFGFHYEGESDNGSNMGYMIHAMDLEKQAERLKKKFEKTRAEEDRRLYEQASLDAQKANETALEKLIFIGRTGRFTPVKEGYGGGQLWRIKDHRPYAINGTKGYLWVDSVVGMNLPDDAVDYGYFDKLVEEGRNDIVKFLDPENPNGFASVEEFLS